MTEVLIREVDSTDYSAWKDLWERYVVFYDAKLPDGHADRLWQRLGDTSDPIQCLVAEASGVVAGIVQFLPHMSTWADRPICYLQDLFVEDSNRGRGIGSALIHAVQGRCREEGWESVYWQTQEDNHRARSLYDKLTGGANGFIVYELQPGDRDA